jgi:hypothetical protein
MSEYRVGNGNDLQMVRPVNRITAKSNLGIGGSGGIWPLDWIDYRRINPVVNDSKKASGENAEARVDIWERSGRANVIIT